MCVRNLHTVRLQHGEGQRAAHPQAEQQEALLAADKLLDCLESLFQSEIKEEKTLETGYSGVLLFNLHQQAIKPPAPEQKTSCQNNGGRLKRRQAFTVGVLGEHRPFNKDAGQGGG